MVGRYPGPFVCTQRFRIELPCWECVLGVHWTLGLRYKHDPKRAEKAVDPQVKEKDKNQDKKVFFGKFGPF